MKRHMLIPMAALALLPASGFSQTAGSGARIEVTPFAGYVLPSDLIGGPLGTRLTVGSAPVFGAQLAFRVAPGVALVGSVSRSGADLEVGVPFLGGLGVGRSEAWAYDGGVQLALPTGASGVRPFVQVGAGVIERRLSVWEIEVSSTSPVFQAGAGLDLQLAPGLAARLMVRDHVGRFDFGDAVLVDLDGSTMHHVTLGAGLRLAF